MRSLLILACNRPKHLYVTLESVSKIKNVKDWDIVVSLDQPDDEQVSLEIDKTLGYFEIDRIYKARIRKRILDMTTDSLSYEFSFGAEEVIYLEDDFIVRSDVLEYIDSVGREEFMISLSGTHNTVACHYRPRGNLITRRKFAELCRWVKQREYIGLYDIYRSDRIFNMADTTHDAIFSGFIDKYNKMVRFPAEYYIAHFGVTGIHLNTEEAQIAEAEIFSGDRTEWLESVLSAIKNERFSAIIQKRLWPKEYEYQ